MKRTICTILSILLLACSTACGSDSDVIYITPESEMENDVEYNVESLSFVFTDDVSLQVGEEKSSSYVTVSVRDRDSFSPEDVIFVSEDPNVATIEFKSDALTTFLYYRITAVGGGETYLYAKAKDGDAVSEKIHVIVEGDPYVETVESQTETEPETVPETAPETTIETEPETASETVPETTAETAPETAVETAPETVTETEPETVAETVPETVPETAPVTVQETIPETTATEESVLKLVSVTTPCENGSNATLSIIGKPNTEYKISVFYSSGPSKAKGLEQKTSDANGNVSWTWKVGANTTAGVHKITISGGDEVLDTSFETYK